MNSFCLLYVATWTIFLKNTPPYVSNKDNVKTVPWFEFDLQCKSRQNRTKRSQFIMRTRYEYGKQFEKIIYYHRYAYQHLRIGKGKKKAGLKYFTPLLISFSFNWGIVAVWIGGGRIGFGISGKAPPWQLVWNNEFPGNTRGSKEAIVTGVNKLKFLPCVLPMNWLCVAGCRWSS